MIGITALIMGGLAFAIIIIMAISFLSVIVGFLAGGVAFLITGSEEVAKGWILLITLIVIIGLISWIL